MGVALWSFGTLLAPSAAHLSLGALCATRAFVRPIPPKHKAHACQPQSAVSHASLVSVVIRALPLLLLQSVDQPHSSFLIGCGGWQVGLGEGLAPSSATNVMARMIPEYVPSIQ